MSGSWGFFGHLARRSIHGSARSDRKTIVDGKRDASHSPLIIETLEPRMLLAADPLGITAGYAFNEVSGTTTADASGHGIVGTLTNGATFTAGRYGNAVALDGVNDFVDLGNPTALQLTGSMTLSAWVYVRSFPADDAPVVSKRTWGESGYQLDITADTGPRTIGFKLTNSSGGQMFRYGATALQPNTWYHVAGVYDAAGQTLNVYLNGVLDNGQLIGTVTSSQQNSMANVNIGSRPGRAGFEFPGLIDDVRIANHALTPDQIQTDMATPLAGTADTIAPTVSFTPPASIVSGTVSLAASASDNIGVAGVKFLLDGNTLVGTEDTTSPYGVSWTTTTASNGSHALTAQARDAANNITTSTPVNVTVDNQAPTGTVTINGGAAATNSTSVTLTLTATDAVTSVKQMRFSNSGSSYSTAEAFAPTKAWTLSNATGGTKTVYVQFMDAAGNWSAAATDTIVLDTTAPTISGQTATNITGSTARVTWTTNEAATSRVEYGLTTGYGSSTTLDTALVTAHSVALTGLAPNTTYNYRVRSIDAAGNERIGSNATFTTSASQDATPPSTPTGLVATAASTTQINLSWNASTDNVAVTGYQVFRNGAQVGTPTTTTFSDTGLSPGTSYTYTVRARDAASNLSGQSAPASATTLTPDTTLPTATITAPTGSATVSGTITISANASDNVGVAGVTFLVDNVAVGGGEDTTSPYSISWDSSTLANGVHTITARARDNSGNTGVSLPVSITVSNTQTPGLVAAYSFDEGSGTTAGDSSGQSNLATLNNGVAWIAGKNGRAASFDGVNDFISIPNSASTNISGNALTLSMWINPQALASGDSVVIGKFWNTTMSSPYYQYGLELRGGNQTDFYIGTSSGALVAAGGTTLPFNQWSHLAITFDGAQVKTYVNGTLVNTQALSATITARGNPMRIGADASTAQFYKGALDDLRIYNRALTLAQVQSDMTTPVGNPTTGSPQVLIDSPINGAQVSGIVNVTADATDDTGIANVQFYIDNVATGSPDATDPYALVWDTRTASNGAHTIAAMATDIDGHATLSAPITVNVANSSFFQNEILATGFNLPTAIKFLPDGRMLVVELAGTVKILPPPYTTPDPTPFLQLTNIGSAGVQQGIYDIALDPNFNTNHYYYIFYTLGTPNVDRFSRFTANAALTGTVPGSEFVIYQDTEIANAEHHGGAINFSNDGKILLTTGEHFQAGESQDLTKPRGKILRYNMDGTVPTDNPFYDGSGPNYDAVWALGLRNPFRAYYDAPTGRLIIGDVGGNAYSTAIEELDIGAKGANYGWPNVETPNGNPAYTAPAYYYPHNGRDAAVVAGFVYHGTQFPSSYQGSFFFADYTQNWIKRLTFDANGNVTGVFNFEPADGSVDGPYGDIVYLTEGPDGALYYVDLGYSDISGTFGVSKIRRIEFIQSDLPPVATASASPTKGPSPLTVNFSSNGSSDPEGKPLTYSWNFGDGVTSTAANPSHTYTVAGPYQARLTVSDGVNSTLSTPIAISVGNSPVVSLLAPTDGATFRAGNVITFSGTATDAEDGTLPASAYTWNIDFLHEGHVHPGIPITGVTSGTFTIPTSGHDFSGFTRYRITLTVTDSSGLQSSQSVTIFPDKVNLNFNTSPAGLTLYLDGIARTTPFTYDTLIGFNHEIEARNATVGSTTYNFVSWSDSGTQDHIITAPVGGATYTATYNAVTTSAPLAFVQVTSATPQTNQTQVSVAYTNAQTTGNTNILVIGWNNTTSNITSVTDSAGNVYQLAVPTARGSGISQAIYYAPNIKQAAAGTNTVAVTFNTATQYVDIRALEYSGLALINPFDIGASAAGTSSSASTGAVTTSTAHELIFGAGTTTGGFTAAGSGFTTRVITTPDLDIAQDRFVTATGSYSATASLQGSAAWVMQVATFKAVG
ncbi:LamG-like jellyroll fold domain-containing protein [Bradyrhizobium sp. 164]|uniref:LamG-like jellyroll fold domain-containing protein n=1 Tax=Bradyrhizobium sp. 164 TaxID=2782637 RepID=UPI001FF9AF93|nr:LamG-like jellyroll fold domain-containing protein [Bradyrhizobium sp. 164]MCK1597287.1 PQQ-dependent sugar dehydrogenase [Bradyrhizobium sp. 164]